MAHSTHSVLLMISLSSWSVKVKTPLDYLQYKTESNWQASTVMVTRSQYGNFHPLWWMDTFPCCAVFTQDCVELNAQEIVANILGELLAQKNAFGLLRLWPGFDSWEGVWVGVLVPHIWYSFWDTKHWEHLHMRKSHVKCTCDLWWLLTWFTQST